MRRFILIVLLFVAPHSFAFAPDAPDQRAIDAFLKTQDEKTDPVLNAQISELMQAGYKERGSTSAVLLREVCGFAGCDVTYLVTSVYSMPEVNRQSTIVAAIVGAHGSEVRVGRILARAEIESLVHPK
jgi:hypothetical protein